MDFAILIGQGPDTCDLIRAAFEPSLNTSHCRRCEINITVCNMRMRSTLTLNKISKVESSKIPEHFSKAIRHKTIE